MVAGAFLLASSWAAPALACNIDTDCPGATCGGQVCEWPAHACAAAGTSAQGSDGWCSGDTDCKCMGEGATCQAASSHCTFTIAPDAGASAADASASAEDASATSSSSSGGATSSSGSSSGSGGTVSSNGGGYSSGAATSSSSGSSSGATGSSSGETLPDADVSSGSTSSSNSGGCSVTPSRSTSSTPLFAIACAAALALIGRRRRD